jgi:hypothetical protein
VSLPEKINHKLKSPESLIIKGSTAKRPRRKIISRVELFIQKNMPKLVAMLKSIKRKNNSILIIVSVGGLLEFL